MFPLLLLQAVLVYVTSWTLWRLVKMFLVKSPLHDLPGPSRLSLISGAFKVSCVSCTRIWIDICRELVPGLQPRWYTMASRYGEEIRKGIQDSWAVWGEKLFSGQPSFPVLTFPFCFRTNRYMSPIQGPYIISSLKMNMFMKKRPRGSSKCEGSRLTQSW